jgi:type II secretion system protein N
VYLLAAMATFPYPRLRSWLEGAAREQGYHVTIGELGPAFPLGVSAEDIVARPLPAAPIRRGEPTPAPMVIDRLDARVSLLSLLVGSLGVELDATLGSGRVLVEVEQGNSALRVRAVAENVALGGLPGLAQASPLPLSGIVDGRMTALLPGTTLKGKRGDRTVYKLSEADGSIELDARDCAIGDGKAKLTVPGDPFLQAGLTVPRIRLGTLGGAIQLEHGVARLRNLESKSPDGELSLSGSVALSNVFPRSMARLYLTVRLSEELKKREATIGLLTQSIPAAAKRADGSSGFQIVGVLSRPSMLPSKTAPAGG